MDRVVFSGERYPVGKSTGEYTEKGADLMHVLDKDEESGQWRLRCKPKKTGRYDYKAVKSVITCNLCKRSL